MMNFIKKHKIDIILFGLALGARAFLFCINLEASKGDLLGAIHGDDGYYELSQGILAGHGFSWDVHEPFRPNTLRTPLYIYFISAIVFVTGSFGFAILVQVILGALIPILGRHIALAITPRHSIGLWVGILLALEPYLVLFSTIFYTETVFIFLFLIFILLFIRYLKQGSLRLLVWSSFVLGLATLTKTTVQYLPLALALLILWHFRTSFSGKKRVVHALLFLAVFVVTLSPWLYRNYREFGVVGMTAQPPFNLNVYLVPSVLSLENGTSLNSEVAKFVTTEESSGNKITLANGQEYSKRALDVLRVHPVGLLKSMAITVVTFFTHDGMLTVLQHAGYVPDVHMGKPAISLLLTSPIEFIKMMSSYVMSPLAIILVLRLAWVVATILFFIGLFRFIKIRKFDGLSMFLLLTLFYFVATSAIGGLGVNARYRMPIDPILFTFALTGFVYIRNAILDKYEKWNERRESNR